MNDFLTALPWVAMLFVFFGMAILQWRVIGALNLAVQKTIQQIAPPAPVPVPAPIPAPAPASTPVPKLPLPAPAPLPLPAPAPAPHIPVPAPTGPFASAPVWFQWAVHEIGFQETGTNQGIERYIGLAHTGSLGDAWCAIFTNAALESSGIMGSRSPSSQSFRTNANFVQLAGPCLGAVVVFWRGTKTSGLGHVGFYRGEDANSIWVLGGNESDMVQIEALPKSSATFGLVGYWWPKTVPLPTTGAVLMPTGSPNVKVAPNTSAPASPAIAGVQTDITATMFGGQQSAYGGPIIDTNPGIALPFRFTGTRPRVRVTNKKLGLTTDCDIVDVGPWNINDPYWKTGARPQAESGTDLGQVGQPRKTNKAGIDLTLAAAEAVKIDGKGIVDWTFIDSNLAAVAAALQPPKVT